MLKSSIPISENSTRRIGVDYNVNEFIIFFHEIRNAIFHGHSRSWKGLNSTMQAVLRKQGLVTKKGKIIIEKNK